MLVFIVEEYNATDIRQAFSEEKFLSRVGLFKHERSTRMAGCHLTLGGYSE
jgi:hypothetical protein